jgi:TolB-like protein/Tfp pilus assembly protein PilF
VGLWAELRRRNVIRVAGLYLVGGWLVVQVAETLLPIFGTPDWVLKTLVVLVALLFIPALAFSWVYELTPDGLKRERDVSRDASIVDRTARKLDIAVIVLLLAVGTLVTWQRFDQIGADADADAAAASDTAGTGDAAAAKDAAVASSAPTPPGSSIAVLPFVNLSADADNEYFSDGITEEILNALTHIEGLKVAGRTSSFHFKGRNEDLKAIGAALGVAHVLEGSVRRQGERVRITAQLIKVDDGFHVWSQNYDRTLDDIFAVQDEISVAIATALESRLTAGGSGSGAAHIDAATYDLYLQARQALATRDGAKIAAAADLFATVNERAPAFAPAWAGRTKALSLLFNYTGGAVDPAKVDTALQAAERALALDPGNAEALAMKAFTLVTYRWDFANALAAARAAIDAAPTDAEVANFAGDTFRMAGELDEALVLEQRAAELDPLFFVNPSDLGWVLLMRRDYRQAVDAGARSLRLDPTYWSALDMRARALLALGDVDAAEAEIDRFEALAPELFTIDELRARVALARGDLDAARPRIAAIEARADAGETVHYVLAVLQARLGDHAAAAASLDRAFAAREPLFVSDVEWIQPSDWPADPAIRAILARPELAPVFAARARFAADADSAPKAAP